MPANKDLMNDLAVITSKAEALGTRIDPRGGNEAGPQYFMAFWSKGGGPEPNKSSDKISQLIWLQYGNAIRQRFGADLGDKLFFLASEAQKGPLAGDFVPNAYTNQGLYEIGNNLLSTDNVFYSPSALHGFDQALDSLLNWVDLGGTTNPALDAAFLRALDEQDAYDVAFQAEREKAYQNWLADKKMGLTIKSFKVYVDSGEAPRLRQAQNNVAAISQRIIQIQQTQEGPMAVTVKNDRDALNMGRNRDVDFAGYNMHGAAGNILSNREMSKKVSRKERIPDPTIHRLPLYNAPSYRQFVQDAMGKSKDPDYHAPKSITVDIDTGKDISDYDFGQIKGGGSAGASVGWFSFIAGAGHSSESTTLETSSESSKLSIKVTYDDLQAITINPGLWNFDVSKYKLRSDAPKSVRTLARVTQMVVVSRIGYEITVDASTAERLDTKLKETTSAGGSISVFGIPISLGGSGTNTKEEATHRFSWDKASATFKVEPDFDNNCATVVGLVGEKFSML